MSCSCTSPCSCDDSCPSTEPLSSALDNFITSFFGTLTKTCVNGQFVWVLPCELCCGTAEFPKNDGEGLACYFLRWIKATSANTGTVGGVKGYRLTTLSNTSVILFRFIDVINQDFTGTLTAPVTIYLSSNGAQNGDEFYLSFDDVDITATNTLSINSDGTTIEFFNTAGSLTGNLKAVFTGTAWKLTANSTNLI